jgi:hypothetical protein
VDLPTVDFTPKISTKLMGQTETNDLDEPPQIAAE